MAARRRELEARSDEELWSAIATERDVTAFSVLCQRHQELVDALARRLTGNTELAHDVTQEVFLRLWETPHRFELGRSRLRLFLLQDCHGRSVDRIRSEDRGRRRGSSWAARQGVTSASAEEVALRALLSDRLLELIGELPEQQRKALSLAFIDGHSYRVVATRLNVPEGTAKARIRAGLLGLRRSLRATGSDFTTT